MKKFRFLQCTLVLLCGFAALLSFTGIETNSTQPYSFCLSPSLHGPQIIAGGNKTFTDNAHPEISYAQDSYTHEDGPYEMNAKYRRKYLNLFVDKHYLMKADYFPYVMPSVPIRFAGAGKKSLIKHIPFNELDSSSAFKEMLERMGNSKAAQTGKIVMMNPDKLHFVLVPNLNHAIGLNTDVLPSFKIKMQGLWWSQTENENSQLFIKVYPQTNVWGLDIIGDVLRGGRPYYTPVFKPTVYPVRLFCLRKNLTEEEALELQDIVNDFSDANFGQMHVQQLEVAHRVDRVLSKSEIIPLPLDQNPFDVYKYSVPAVSWQLTKFRAVAFAKQTLTTLWQDAPANKELDKLFDIVLNSQQFQRLGYITQGTITHMSPTETRMHHTVEVVKLANQVGLQCARKGLKINIKKLMLAAILHDLGHSAFGHLGEKSNRYKSKAQQNIFEHDYRHAEQSVVIMDELFGHLPQSRMIKEIKAAVLNHGGKDLVIKNPKNSIYGSLEGALLMFCDEISRLGSDMKYTWFHGIASWDDLLELTPDASDLLINLFKKFTTIDTMSETIVDYFVTDLMENTTNKTVGLSADGSKAKHVLDKLIRETLISRMRKLNHYDTWIKAMAFVLKDKSPETQITFLRTATDETIYNYLKAAGYPLPSSGFVDPFSAEAGQLNYDPERHLIARSA